MKRVATWPLLIGLVGAGCNPGPTGTPTFELVAKTEIKNGSIRRYALTNYTFYENYGGRRKEIWHLDRQHKYDRHWISPTGRIWVATASMPGPGGGGMIWSVDRAGRSEAWARYDLLLPPKAERALRHAATGMNAVDFSKVQAVDLGKGVEQLRLPLNGGGEGRATLIPTREGLLCLQQTFAKGEEDVLADMVEKGISLPTLTRPIPDQAWLVWRAEGYGRELAQFAWSPLVMPDGPKLNFKVNAQNGLPAAEKIGRLSNGPFYWLAFSKPREAPQATLSLSGIDGKLRTRIDLLKMGASRTVAELRKAVDFDRIQERVGGEWRPLSLAGSGNGFPADALELTGSGRRYVIDLSEPNVKVQAQTGLASRRPKEGGYRGGKVLRERIFASPNGGFRLRDRAMNWPGGGKDRYLTMLGETREPDGTKVFLEMWSMYAPENLLQVRVMDTGRSFLLDSDEAREGRSKGATLRVLAADGYQYAGNDLLQSPGIFQTADEALEGIDRKGLTMKGKGAVEQKSVEDVSTRTPRFETYRLPIGKGKVWEFQIGPGYEGRAGMSWIADQFRVQRKSRGGGSLRR